MEEKKAIRKQIFAARKAHTDQQIDDWSKKIAETVTSLSEYRDSQRILAYADYNHEVMTRYIIEAAWKDGKEVAVPKVVGKDMVFYKLTDFAQLEAGYFGIPEPARGEIVQWEEALMIMPGVAFDRANHRVGYGGGFYDRFLEKHPQIRRVAVAFEFQMMPEVPTEPTDISPEIIVTEEEIYRLK
mgnify:FL=1|nr:5-formyltetrahydrofolate cyclo-ligase [uncultured Blautia sp.]